MSEEFAGFPGVARATAIPNVFFASVLPRMVNAGELLAFLWVSRLVQDQRGEARFVTADQVWAEPGAAQSFAAMGRGREGLEQGLRGCAQLGALLALRVAGSAGETDVFFVNNPQSRRAVARARAGELSLRPETIAYEAPLEQRPGIFRLYEDHIGTITPMVAEKLIQAAERYPPEWVEEAFREAAELNARSWRYVERILKNWDEEGRGHEAAGRDSLEERKRRYLGGNLGHVVRYR
jgi:DNA replication protein